MSTGFLILIGLILLCSGLFSIFAGNLWNQGKANEQPSAASSQRPKTWNNSRTIIGTLAVIVGVIFLVLGLLRELVPQPAAGEYTCSTGTDDQDLPETLLKLERGGQGTYNNFPLTWLYDAEQQIITFENVSIVSGNFPIKDDMSNLVLTDTLASPRYCVRR